MSAKTKGCRDCGESLGGKMQHGINAERAAKHAQDKCSECGTLRPVRCVWGAEEFYYVCKPCRRGWNTGSKIKKPYPVV